MSGTGKRTSPFDRLYDRGSTRYIMALRSRGESDAQIEEKLMNMPEAPSRQQARALIHRANQAEAAGDEFNRRKPNYRIEKDDVRRPDTGCLRWHYVVQVHWSIPGGPVHSPVVAFRKGEQWTRQQVLDYALGVVQSAVTKGDAADRNYGGGFTNVQPLGAEIVAVERGC